MVLQKSWAVLFVALLAFSRVAYAQGPVAKVVAVKGDVKLERAVLKDKDKLLPLEEFEVVYRDDKLLLGEGAQVTLILREDHRRCRIEKAGEYTMGKDKMGKDRVTPVEGVVIEAKATRSRLSEKDYARILEISRPGVVVARSAANLPLPITPVTESTLTTDRPTFSWPACADAQLYRVQVWEDIEDQPRRPLWTKETTETTAIYDGDPLPSRLGTTYRWAVAAQDKNQLPTEFVNTTFRVANPDDREFGARLSQAAQGEDVVEVALSATALSEKGMVFEAIAAYEHLIELVPDSIRFRLELTQLYRQAGQAEQAEKQVKECEELGYRFVDETEGESICR
jgi:hypothetical protein